MVLISACSRLPSAWSSGCQVAADQGLYLAVTTLAAQFFLEWCFIRIPWLYNYNSIPAPSKCRSARGFRHCLTGPAATDPLTQYFVVLASSSLCSRFAVKNIVRGRIGRQWMMIRDMDIAAELMGVRPLVAKLSAFAVSSYICGVAGAMFVFFYLGRRRAFGILDHAVVPDPVHGDPGRTGQPAVGCVLRCSLHLGPADRAQVRAGSCPRWASIMGAETVFRAYRHFMIVGALIIFFLIVEPHGLARLWSLAKEKLRVWPFPY
jgi:branched-chain amino acid transport system permease protein